MENMRFLWWSQTSHMITLWSSCVLLFTLPLLSHTSEIYKNLFFVRLPKGCNTLLRHTPKALDWKVSCWTLPSASKEPRYIKSQTYIQCFLYFQIWNVVALDYPRQPKQSTEFFFFFGPVQSLCCLLAWYLKNNRFFLLYNSDYYNFVPWSLVFNMEKYLKYWKQWFQRGR